MKSVSLAITILVIVALAALTLWVLQFIYLIMGWSKIKNGGFNRNLNSSHVEEETEDFESYCNGATEEVILEEGSIADDESHKETRLIGEESYSELCEVDSNKRWMIWGGIGVGIIALFLIIWLAWLNPSGKSKENLYVFTQYMPIYQTPSEDGDEMCGLSYGDKVTVLENVSGGDWAKVRYNDENGNEKEGFASLSELVTHKEFETLEGAGFKKEYVRQSIQAPGQRKAAIDYFSQNQGDSIKIVSPSCEGVCALAAACDGVETLAFVAGKKYTSDVLVVYTIDDNGTPRLYSQNEMPKDAEGIKDIIKTDSGIHVTLTPKQGNNGISMSLDEEISDEEMVTMPKATDYYDEPAGDEYTHVYSGTINGKYAVEMTLTTDGGTYYTGEYFYTKNKTPIQLRGRLTDDYEHLVLEEYVGMDMTGKFEGTLSPKRYRGIWTSADGNTSYPFELTAK